MNAEHRNHPLVRLSQSAPAAGGGIRLDVGSASAFLSLDEALRLHADLERMLVLRGALEAREVPA